MVSNFIGGAVGSALASVLWSIDGWTAVSLAGAGLGCLALTVWAVGRPDGKASHVVAESVST